MLECRLAAVIQVICCVPSVLPVIHHARPLAMLESVIAIRYLDLAIKGSLAAFVILSAALLPTIATCDLTLMMQVLKPTFERMSGISAIMRSRDMCGDSVHFL